MSGFNTDGPAPDWLSERFDQRTTLPRGPLEHLPLPLDCHIVRAASAAPDSERPQWTVGALAGESSEEALRFFEEYLPLAGYTVLGIGVQRTRRTWRARPASTAIVVIHRDAFVGTVSLRAEQQVAATIVEVHMGHPELDAFMPFASFEAMHDRTDIQWRRS